MQPKPLEAQYNACQQSFESQGTHSAYGQRNYLGKTRGLTCRPYPVTRLVNMHCITAGTTGVQGASCALFELVPRRLELLPLSLTSNCQTW